MLHADTIFYGTGRPAEGFTNRLPVQGTEMNPKRTRQPNRVTAIFQHAALTFDMARETSLAQLAEQLGRLGEIHGGLPLSIDVRVAVEAPH